MRASQTIINEIKKSESLHDGNLSTIALEPKMCPGSLWTQAYGHAIIYKGKHLKGAKNKELAYRLFTVKDEKEAEMILKNDLGLFERVINADMKAFNKQLTQNQFDALLSLIFNIGQGAWKRSNLRKEIMTKEQSIQIALEWIDWNRAGGRFLRGLFFRRKREIKLYYS